MRKVDARALFTGIAPSYGWPAELLSFAQYGRWRATLAGMMPIGSGHLILDVATGTGLTALRLQSRSGGRVVGVDLTPAMLERAAARTAKRTSFAAADARALPFADATFDALCFSYLLRYVDDVHSTLAELVRVLKPGGALGSMEFSVPRRRWARALWWLYSMRFMRILTVPFGRGWRAVGDFLGPSIVAWDDAWPLERQLDAWRTAGVEPSHVREPSFGACTLIVGRKR